MTDRIPDEIMREAIKICDPSFSGGTRVNDAQHIVDVARALMARDQRAAEIEREAQKQKERLFKQIDFTGELQRLLWALAEGNPLPDTIKGSHAYTVASRAKARFGGTPE